MNGDDELSLKDITFLRAIRDINGSPERYASTEQGVTPATVTAITEATTLSEEEVAYRLDHPRLGKSGLVTVYEAGPPADESASLNSAELTEAGERAIAEAEDRESSVDAEEWRPDQEQSEFDDMQEWEPAEVESGHDAARPDAGSGTSAVGAATAHANADPTAAPPTEAPERVSTGTGGGPATTTEDATADRIAALEQRIEQLEAETASAGDDSASTGGTRSVSAADDRLESLSEEMAALRETTDRLESTLDDALDDLDEIRESETGALDEKREQQFETAVKSMVAFHQLASEVLDVRVENYEPSAGRADPERVEISRNRIGDALGVGQSGGGGGRTLEMDDDGNWPDPEEAARGGRVFSGSDEASESEPEQASDAPESGVYPPIGGDDSAQETDDAETAAGDDGHHEESDAPDSGVYPPIGEDRDDEPTDEESGEEPAEADLPASIRPDTDAAAGNITETAAEEGHVVDPIRSTGDGDHPGDSRLLDIDAEVALSIRRAVTDRDESKEEANEDLERSTEATDGNSETTQAGEADSESDDPWLLGGVDPAVAREVREAVRTSDESMPLATDDPYPAGEAYARIVDESLGSTTSASTTDGGRPGNRRDD